VFVVRTFSQLEEAVRGGTPEVMVVGRFASELLLMEANPGSSSKSGTQNDLYLSTLSENYNISAIRDNSENVIALLRQRKAEELTASAQQSTDASDNIAGSIQQVARQ
jgi:hypothetical protein